LVVFFILQNPRGGHCLLLPVTGYVHVTITYDTPELWVSVHSKQRQLEHEVSRERQLRYFSRSRLILRDRSRWRSVFM